MTKAQWNGRCATLAVSGCLALLAACNSSSGALSEQALSACRDYRQFTKDTATGILTFTEERERVKTIYEESKGSEIQDQTRELLAAWTQESEPAQLIAVRRLTLTCTGVDIFPSPSLKPKDKACEDLGKLRALIATGHFHVDAVGNAAAGVYDAAKGTGVEEQAKAIFLTAADFEGWKSNQPGNFDKLQSQIASMAAGC